MFRKETEYALRALIYIYQQNQLGEKPGITEIAEEILAPRPFIAKVLQRLVKSDVLHSQKGKGGGFFFKNDQDDIVLKDVIVLLEGQKGFTSCGFGNGQCDDSNSCAIHPQYVKVRSELNRIFEENTVMLLAGRPSLKDKF